LVISTEVPTHTAARARSLPYASFVMLGVGGWLSVLVAIVSSSQRGSAR
jgi:hypothetical protein